MSGGYTHITVVNMMSEPARLEETEGFPEEAIICIMDFFKFCELKKYCKSPFWYDSMETIKLASFVVIYRVYLKFTKKKRAAYNPLTWQINILS